MMWMMLVSLLNGALLPNALLPNPSATTSTRNLNMFTD
jgi:hypothetical protein